MSPLQNSILLLALVASTALAAPQQVFAPTYCKTETINKEEHKKTDVIPQTGDYSVAGGSSLTMGSSFTASTTITIGADLGLTIKEIVSFGVSGSVSLTEAKGTSQSASVPCPEGPWKCALQIYPDMLVVSGTIQPKKGSESACSNSIQIGDYEAVLPVLGDNKEVQSRVEICACRNYAHWSDAGAPSLVCDVCP